MLFKVVLVRDELFAEGIIDEDGIHDRKPGTFTIPKGTILDVYAYDSPGQYSTRFLVWNGKISSNFFIVYTRNCQPM